jgi:hypothetical protein
MRLTLSLPELLARRAAAGPVGVPAPTLWVGTRRRQKAEDSEGGGKAKSCILFFQEGGLAHQDSWDIKPHAPAEVRGQFQPIRALFV